MANRTKLTKDTSGRPKDILKAKATMIIEKQSPIKWILELMGKIARTKGDPVFFSQAMMVDGNDNALDAVVSPDNIAGNIWDKE